MSKRIKLTEGFIRNMVRQVLRESELDGAQLPQDIRRDFIEWIEKIKPQYLSLMVDHCKGDDWAWDDVLSSYTNKLGYEYLEDVPQDVFDEIEKAVNEWWYYAQSQFDDGEELNESQRRMIKRITDSVIRRLRVR